MRRPDSPAAVLVLFGFLVGCASGDTSPAGTDAPLPGNLHATTLVSGLDTPWDLVWGPDDHIWVSERGGRISRVDPRTGERTTAGELDVHESGESGLMGIAFHPDFGSSPYLYAVHSYSEGGRIRNRLVRMRWESGALGPPEVLLDGIPGAGIHDGSRIVIGPDRLVYMSTGDASNPASAQDRNSLAGKILRLDLDGDPAPGNPFGNATYSFGHRNPQGLVFGPAGALLSSEHGPGDNDEVNRILAGRNYGWPDVHGFCDNDISDEERAFCQANDVVEPLAAWTPPIAVCGADFYDGALVPEWRGSLLVTSLRGRALYRLALSEDGTRALRTERLLAGQYGRLRDVLVGPRGEIYLATSNRDGRGSPVQDDDRILRIDTR